MTKKQLLELGLSEEQAEKVLGINQEQLKGFVEKSKFEEVKSEKKILEDSVKERDTQLETLKTSSESMEALKKQIETLQGENKAKDEQHRVDVESLKVNNAIDLAITKYGGKNSKAIKALIDMDNIKIKEDGSIIGLDKQFEKLTTSEDSSFLFGDLKGTPDLKGVSPSGNNGTTNTGKVDFSKMTYSEQVKFMAENPDIKVE